MTVLPSEPHRQSQLFFVSEMREQFDSGSDPLDPEEQQQQNNPFHQGFNPFGQGGFQFKFHFN